MSGYFRKDRMLKIYMCPAGLCRSTNPHFTCRHIDANPVAELRQELAEAQRSIVDRVTSRVVAYLVRSGVTVRV